MIESYSYRFFIQGIWKGRIEISGYDWVGYYDQFKPNIA